MLRRDWILGIMLAAVSVASAQDRRASRIDVEHYVIEAEVNPATQTLTAKAQVRFVAKDDKITSAVFELNNALNVSKIEDGAGKPIAASRSQQESSVTLTFPDALAKAQPSTVTFYYDGKLTGAEESPVFGIKFAAIHPDYSYLLYPARWFPVSGYTTDRFSANMRITVPAGSKVIASGIPKTETAADGKQIFNYTYDRPAFPGSIAVVTSDAVQVQNEGVVTNLFFRGAEKDMANGYGQEFGKAMSYLTGLYGLPPQANLTVVETEDGAANGYAAPGLVFLSPGGIGKQVSGRLVANQVSRQWWGQMLSPVTRNHIWITNGMARYTEVMYLEHNNASSVEPEVRDLYVDALTVSDPVAQVGRMEDYSPEFWALSASKGAAVLHMLRYVIGDQNFTRLIKEFPAKYAWNSVSTDDFQKTAEAIYGQNLGWFFLQWIESSGAPEFKIDYTVFRTQKGFRVMGKVAQDLDTFRMPVEMRINTEGNPEDKRVDVVGTSSEFLVETFGKPKTVTLDPNHRVLRYDDPMRVAVAIRRGEQFAELGQFNDALKEYQKALEVSRNSSLAHYRIAEVFFLQNNFQAAANEFREALNGDLDPKWTEVWAHINLGKIFDVTGQRERALNEYEQATRTKDNTQGALEEAAKYRKTPYQREKKADY